MSFIIFAVLALIALVSMDDSLFAGLAILGVLAVMFNVREKARVLAKQVDLLNVELKLLREKLESVESVKTDENKTDFQADESTTTDVDQPGSEQPIQDSSASPDVQGQSDVGDSEPLQDQPDVSMPPQSLSDSIAARAITSEELPTQKQIADEPSIVEPSIVKRPTRPRKPNIFDDTLRKISSILVGWVMGSPDTSNQQRDKSAQVTSSESSPVMASEAASVQIQTNSEQPSADASETGWATSPPKPNVFDEALKKISDAAIGWITGGNIFVRVGIVILFMGMTFLIRYAVGQGIIPIELRLAAVAAVAIGLLVWGWMQRDKKSNFALVVQGGGIGLLYLTIFASFSLYKIIGSTPAFVLLAFVVIFAAVLSVLQNSKSLALFATVGGFLAPILTSSGSNNYIGLFSYYSALNAGIFAIAWFKSWRILNFTGFIFTFAISGVWGVLSYQPAFFSSTEPFLIIFFLMYVAISVLFALRRAPNFKDTIDSSLVFGTPLLAFVMQCELVGDYEFGIAISAFVLAAFYLLLSYVLWKRYSRKLGLLCETFLSLSVIFATIAIPFAIDGQSDWSSLGNRRRGDIMGEHSSTTILPAIIRCSVNVCLRSDY